MKDQKFFEEKIYRFEDFPKAFDNNFIFVANGINMQSLTGDVFLTQLEKYIGLFLPNTSTKRPESWSVQAPVHVAIMKKP